MLWGRGQTKGRGLVKGLVHARARDKLVESMSLGFTGHSYHSKQGQKHLEPSLFLVMLAISKILIPVVSFQVKLGVELVLTGILPILLQESCEQLHTWALYLLKIAVHWCSLQVIRRQRCCFYFTN